jgi:hypothetical protein
MTETTYNDILKMYEKRQRQRDAARNSYRSKGVSYTRPPMAFQPQMEVKGILTPMISHVLS